MIPIRGITVCVEYDCELAITLQCNMRHMTECLVITTAMDHRTHQVVSQVPGARMYITDAFYRDGAKFNKGLAMEEGFAALGRWGQILIWDADILLPDRVTLPRVLDRDTLYGSPRKILHDPKRWSPDLDWNTIPADKDPTIPGYFQLFNAEAQSLVKKPWYGVDFAHAGGGDAMFMMRFGPKNRQKLPFDVLHIGPNDRNWFGRTSERLDGDMIPEPLARERAAGMKTLQHNRGRNGRLPWEQRRGFPQ